MATTALITARRDSVRLPHKNRLEVGGVPLWRRSMDFALSHGLRAVLDTDDPVILADALKAGLEVHPRMTPSEAHGGTHWQAIEAACDDLGLSSFVLLQPTSPFRSHDILDRCLKSFDGRHPVLTYSSPHEWWDGNIGIWPHPRNGLAPVFIDQRDWRLSWQVDTPEDLETARSLEP